MVVVAVEIGFDQGPRIGPVGQPIRDPKAALSQDHHRTRAVGSGIGLQDSGYAPDPRPSGVEIVVALTDLTALLDEDDPKSAIGSANVLEKPLVTRLKDTERNDHGGEQDQAQWEECQLPRPRRRLAHSPSTEPLLLSSEGGAREGVVAFGTRSSMVGPTG